MYGTWVRLHLAGNLIRHIEKVQELHKNSQKTIRDCVAYATIIVILSKQK